MSKFCTQTCRPCPEPITGRGPGASRCEQNGLCQRVSMDDLPQLKVTVHAGGGIDLKIEKKQP